MPKTNNYEEMKPAADVEIIIFLRMLQKIWKNTISAGIV